MENYGLCEVRIRDVYIDKKTRFRIEIFDRDQRLVAQDLYLIEVYNS